MVSAGDVGGVSVFTESYAREILRRQKEILVALWFDRSLPYCIKKRGLFDALPKILVEYDSLDKASEVARSISSQIQFRDGDCIIGQSMPWIGHIVSRERTTKDILHVEVLHNDTEQHYELAKQLVPTCDLFCAVSDSIAKTLRNRISKYDEDHIPITVSSGGIDVPSNVTFPSCHTPFSICFIGRFAQEKRVYDLVPLTRYLMDSGIDFMLSIIGGGNEAPLLRERFDHTGTMDRVRFLGTLPHQEVFSYLSKQHALVLTSAYEGGPIVVCEAMALGLVPITTKVGFCEDIIRDGENGFLVEIGDIRTMADRVIRLARDKGMWKKMGQRAWQTAKEELAISKRVDKFLDAVEEVWAARANRRQVRSKTHKYRSVLDHWLIPNWLTRAIRRIWRLVKGRPSDAAPRESKWWDRLLNRL